MLLALVPSCRFIGNVTAVAASERSTSLQLLIRLFPLEHAETVDITDAADNNFVIERSIQNGLAELFRQQP
jgi:hypothetical protein